MAKLTWRYQFVKYNIIRLIKYEIGGIKMRKKLSKILIIGMIFGILTGAILYVTGPEDPPPVGYKTIQRV